MGELKAYRAKRDFGKTAEPRGRIVRAGRARNLSFVVRRHDATRLHYDLRLELDGVYKSWAVTKVPSLDPATKRLAVEVEDHPLEYGTFEGTIPEGEYGGGTVQLWDQGTWLPTSDAPAKDLAKGRLTFEMKGERLTGGWALIRMRPRDERPGRKQRNQWLLIKERDEAARPGEPDALLAEETSVKTGRTLEDIANNKRTRIWHSSRSVAENVKKGSKPVEERGAKTARVNMPARADNVVQGVTISHPDKAMWPATRDAAAVTKLNLARYYERAAERMLPHIESRPISLVRAPDGISGERFYQRHVLAGVASVKPMKVKGEKEPYHAIDDVEGLIALAQAGVLEIHPWGCRKDDPETPERLIFDLDPDPELPFDMVMESAKEVRDVLAACGFEPFVKTTGGKGIHIVVAIKSTPKHPATWPAAKQFAHDLAERVAADSPKRYTTNMSKKQRGGRIFLDYLRNDKTATAVGPWSPRARGGATIAMPLAWRDLRKGLSPADFTMFKARSLLKRADPWRDLAASAIALESARKKLERL